MKIEQLNHVALHATDAEKSCKFYREVLGLEPMQRPAFNFPGGWFRIGVDQELHVIQRELDSKTPPPSERHFALMVDSINGAVALLREKGVQFHGPIKRPDGVWQVFVRDPDGHMIELCSPS